MARKLRQSLLKISEMAQKADVLVSTIRYYTDIGLLKAATTTEGGLSARRLRIGGATSSTSSSVNPRGCDTFMKGRRPA